MLVSLGSGLAGAIFLLVGPATGTDLAAQHARAAFAAAHPGAAVDLSWFGGVQPAAYSVISPYVMAEVGVRLTGALSVLLSTGAFACLLMRWRANQPVGATCWAAAAFTLDVVDGRVTFALGVAVALVALLAVPAEQPASRERSRWWRWLPTLALAALCALTSPVAALFLALAAAGWALRHRPTILLSVAALAPLGVIALLFSEPGRMLDTWAVARPDLLAAAAVVLFCRGLTVRAVAAAYAVAVVAIYLHPGPVGSNIERLPLLFLGPVLICCWRGRRTLLAVALVVVTYWTTQVPIRDWRNAHQQSVELAAAHRLVGDLSTLGPIQGRIEVVPFRQHGEAAVIPQVWPLARGWERQVDLTRAGTLYSGSLTAARYLAWLRANSVQYVAIGAHPHDFGGTHETQLLEHPPAYLVAVHSDPEWRIWRVDGSTPIVAAPGRLAGVTQSALRIDVPAPAVVPVNVRWTRWWHASGGAAVVRRGTTLAIRVPRAETVTLSSSY